MHMSAKLPFDDDANWVFFASSSWGNPAAASHDIKMP